MPHPITAMSAIPAITAIYLGFLRLHHPIFLCNSSLDVLSSGAN
jgi:hypothetical protein